MYLTATFLHCTFKLKYIYTLCRPFWYRNMSIFSFHKSSFSHFVTPTGQQKSTRLHGDLFQKRIILKSLHCLQTHMFSWKLETREKAVNNKQAVQLSRNLMLHILLLHKLYYYTNYYCYYYSLKSEIVYNISISIVRTFLHGEEMCLSSKSKMHLSYIKNLRCSWQRTRLLLKIQIFC